MAKKKKAPTPPAKKKAGPVEKTIRDIIIIVVAFVVIRLWVVEANVIPSGSMKETLLVGDYILAEKVTYHVRDPQPGEVITFIFPFRDMTFGQSVRFFMRNILGESKTGPRLLIKRCIGAPGDVLQIKDHVLYRNGEPVDEPYLKSDAGDPSGGNGIHYAIPLDVPYRVPDDMYFVMGDNRYDSADSRVIGPVPRKYITAKAEIIYFSLAPITCPKHGTPITHSEDGWYCSGGGEEFQPGWDFEPVSKWRFDRRVRWHRMGKLVRSLL
ncbi:MAG: signal peptidase I [Candidatus Zixiibacteriota bacterium]|jgi:signal peptidase I